MHNKCVAGTVMLNGNNGEKKFLLKTNDSQLDFIMAKIDDEHTSLACILEILKEEAHISLNAISLVELSNIQVDNQKIPLYVFEMDEEKLGEYSTEHYSWELPSDLRKVLDFRSVSGVPIFQ